MSINTFIKGIKEIFKESSFFFASFVIVILSDEGPTPGGYSLIRATLLYGEGLLPYMGREYSLIWGGLYPPPYIGGYSLIWGCVASQGMFFGIFVFRVTNLSLFILIRVSLYQFLS